MSYLNNFADEAFVTSLQSARDYGKSYIENDIFRFEMPSSPVIRRVIGNNGIGQTLDREYFELHFYTPQTNELVKSVAVPFSEGYLYIREGAPQNTLRLGLTFWRGDSEDETLSDEERAKTLVEKYLSDVPFGTYNVIVNFFADELGTYDQDDWQIREVSETRREVTLEWNPDEEREWDQTEYKQFAFDSIFSIDFDILIQQLFQSGPLSQGEGREFDRMLNSFLAKLNENEQELLDSVDRQYFINELSIMHREILKQIREYAQAEYDAGRYRIIEGDFYNKARSIIYDVVNQRIKQLPTNFDFVVVE